MFDYDVMTEMEATQERFQLLPDGEYQAVCDSSIDKVSQKSGNPMMDIMWSVYDANGKSHPVRDFLTITRSMMWKVIHCAESTGKLQEYKDKKFCSDIIRGASCIVRIGTEKGGEIPEDKLKGKAPGARYPDRNKVEDYIVRLQRDDVVMNKSDSFHDDDIPF